MHRVAILTLSIGDQYTRSIEPGLKSKLQYAKRWGYTHIVGGVEYHDPSRPIPWSKLGFWLSYLDATDYDFLWLSDADSIITNPDASLDSIIDLVFEDEQIQGVWWEDATGYKNSGQMLVRTRSAAIRQWFTEADAQQDLTHDPWWENKALIRIWDRNPNLQTVIRVRTDYKLINAYLDPSPEKSWTPGCFVLHYPALPDRSWVYRHMTTVARPDLADSGILQMTSTIAEKFEAAVRLQAGNQQLAESLFQQILSLDPNHADSLHFLGLIAFGKGQYCAGCEFIGRAIGVRPNDVLLHCNLGNALQAQGRLDEAVASYRRALAIEPNHAVAYYNLAGALNSLGKTQEAIACYQRAVQLEPGMYQAYHNLGHCHQTQRQLEKAVAYYRQALKLNADVAETYLSLGNVLLVQRKLDDAMACYRRTLELQPDCAQAHANLAVILQAQGDVAEAIACCRRALELKPDYFVAHNNLGDAWLALGQLHKAIKSYRRALEFDPAFDPARDASTGGLEQLARLDDALSNDVQPLKLVGVYPHAIRFVSTREETATSAVELQIDVHGEEEQDCKLVSSHGILKSCDVHPHRPQTVRAFPHAEYPPNWSERLLAGQSVYVCTSAMADFVANVFPRLPASCPPFVLVTGDADELAPADVFPSAAAADEFLNSPRILAWFAQNCVGQHSKLASLPIGLDYHTIAISGVPWWGPQQTPVGQEADLLALRAMPVSLESPHRAYANFHFSMLKRMGRDRRAAMAQIAPHSVYYEPRNTPRLESWRRQRFQHRFVLSPLGNGLDCHRTWEALCLGCIPVVRSSPLDKLWEGLPVWVVHSWSEVTEENMSQKAAEMDRMVPANAGGAIPEKLLLKTWVERIRQAGAAARQ